jgi:hypothetical protein
MPHKDPETKRAYHRDYMRRKRAGVKPKPPPMLSPTPEPSREVGNLCFNSERPHTTERRYPHPAYLVQDGYWFDPQTLALIGEVK